jgi:hypothetical protein
MIDRSTRRTPTILAVLAAALLAGAGCAGSHARYGSDQLAAARYQPERWLQSAAPTLYPSERAQPSDIPGPPRR